MNNLPYNNLLSIGEAAKLLNVSIDTVRRWEKNGRIKSVRTQGGHRRFTHESINNAKNKRTVLITETHQSVSFHLNHLKLPFSFSNKFNNKRIAQVGLALLIISLLIFDVSNNNLVEQSTSSLKHARTTLEKLIPRVELNQLSNNADSVESPHYTPAVLAESTSKDLTFDVNIDAKLKGNLLVDGSATISGTLTASGLNITGALTSQSLTTGALSGTTGVFSGNITVPGIVTNATTINVLNTNATTLNFGGAGTTISIGASSGTTTVKNDLKVSGAFTSSGTLTASGALTVSGTLTASGALNVSGATALSGNLTKINGVTYSWPTTQGAASTLLLNDGSGNLSWTSSTTNLGSVTGVLAIANGGTNNSTAYTAGSVIFSDGTKLTQDNTNFFWNSTTHQLRIGSGGAVIPSVNLGADLGTTALRWNNIYVGTVNSNSTLSTTGQALFTYTPTDTTYGQSSVEINPTTAPANSYLLGLGIAGAQMAGIDAEGDIRLGYSGGAGTSVPASDNPLMIYNHGTTNVFSIDTSGNLTDSGTASISGTLTIGNGSLIQPAYGPLQLAYKSGANAWTVGLVLQDTTGNVGIGTTNPSTNLDIVGNATVSGTIGFKPQLNSSMPTCNATAKGKVYFDGTYNQHYFCNGTNWRSLVGLQDQNRQDITTNNLVNNQVVRKGWGYITGNGANGVVYSSTVTFGITYDDIPIVTSNRHSGRSAASGAPSGNLGSCNAGSSWYITSGKGGMTSAASVTSFVWSFGIATTGDTPIASGDFVCFTWSATGSYAAGADLAEYYRSTEALEAGDVVSISLSEDKKVNKSKGSYDRNAIGIVSTSPGQVLGDENGKSTQSDAYPIALAGRVPLKVSLEGGVVQRGDPLTTSSTPGIAMKATGPGPVIGKAMERFDGTQTISTSNTNTNPSKDDPDLQQLNGGIGKIMVFINNTWWEPVPQPNQLALSIPNINNFSDGDFLIPYISRKENNTLALFTKFSDAKETLLGDETLKLNNLTSQYQAVNTKSEENTSQIQSLQSSIASVSAQLTNVESDIQLLKSSQLVATASSVLGTATDSANLNNLSVLKNTILGDTVVNGKLNIGIMTIDNLTSSIDTIGTLKIQSLALGGIEFENGSVTIDKDGNININKGRIVGNDQIRGSVILPSGHNTVDITPPISWTSTPKTIVITPSFVTSSAVIRLDTNGATIQVGQISNQDQTIYWMAVW